MQPKGLLARGQLQTPCNESFSSSRRGLHIVQTEAWSPVAVVQTEGNEVSSGSVREAVGLSKSVERRVNDRQGRVEYREERGPRRLIDLRNHHRPTPPPFRHIPNPSVEAAYLNSGFSHWDTYEQQRLRVLIPQFHHEYKRYSDQFDEVKRSVAPVRDSPEVLGKKDELKMLRVLQQKEEEMRQKEALERIKKLQSVEEMQKALGRQVEEKRETERYRNELNKAYAQQINFRVAKTREIDAHQLQKSQETKRNYQTALLEQISQRSKSRAHFSQVLEAEQRMLHEITESTEDKLRHIRKPTESRHDRGNGSVFALNAVKMLM